MSAPPAPSRAPHEKRTGRRPLDLPVEKIAALHAAGLSRATPRHTLRCRSIGDRRPPSPSARGADMSAPGVLVTLLLAAMLLAAAMLHWAGP